MPLNPATAARLRRLAVDTRPLSVPEFRRLWLGEIVTVVGNQMTMVAVPVQVYNVTGSSLDVGLTSMVGLAPLVLFGLFGGAVADAMDRRKLLMITSVGLLLTSLGLWVQALLLQPGSLPILWALVAVQSGFFATNSPARSAVIPRLVPAGQVPAANALYQIVFNGGVIVGPFVAGVLISSGSLAWAYFADATTFVVALYTVFRLPPMHPDVRRRAGVGSVLEGLAFLRLRPVLMMTFAVDIVAMVFGWPRALFPQLAATEFGASSLGWLYAAAAIGALAAAVFGGWLSRVNRQGLAVLVAVAAWGVAIAAFGLTHSLVLAVVFLALAGAGDMVSAVFRSSILQTAVPDEMRGRLQGVFTVVVAGGPRLGDMRAGGFASVMSVGLTSVTGGVMVLIGVLVIALAVPAFTRFDARNPRLGRTGGDVVDAVPVNDAG
jgi:MFS family permease